MLSTIMHSGQGGEGIRKIELIRALLKSYHLFVSIVYIFSEFSLDIELSQIIDFVNRFDLWHLQRQIPCNMEKISLQVR